jgi:plasmid maintenance system antidote protein VapI
MRASGEILGGVLETAGSDGKRARENDRGVAQPYHAILKHKRCITGDTAIRLGTFFQNVGGILDEPSNDLRPA